MKDAIGDRMKEYEARFCPRLMPLLPTLARIDGRAFHAYTNKLMRPFDHQFVSLMQDTTQALVKETHARVGYTQSDEITLCFYSSTAKSQTFFNGKSQKLTSVLASMATAHFNNAVPLAWKLDSRVPGLALFDCRVWQVPTLCEAANVFVWRELDATRNSLEMLARSHFSHRELHKKNSKDLHEMLHTKGVNWNELPSAYKRGTYFGWKSLPISTAMEPRMRKKVVPLQLEPILSYTDRVKTLFDIDHTCGVVNDNVAPRE